MAYRDVLFAPLTSVFVLGGLTSQTIEVLPRAMEVVVRARRSARRRPRSALLPSFAATGSIEALVGRNVQHLGDEADDADLLRRAHARGLQDLPFALVLTPTRAAVVTAHAVFDGTGALELIHDLLAAAAGAGLPEEERKARLPVMQALRQVRPADARAFVEARRHRPHGPDRMDRRSRTAGTSAAFALDSTDVATIRRYREPDRIGRPTLHSRIASIAIAALREVEVGGLDVPVWVTTDLRHLVHGRVEGNFIGRELIGTLHGDQWAPGALAIRLLRTKGSGQALSLIWSSTGWLIRSALRRRPLAGEEVVLTLATTRRTLPVPVGRVLATSVGGSPTFVFAWQASSTVFVSAYDADGRFDLSRFESVFRRLVEERSRH